MSASTLRTSIGCAIRSFRFAMGESYGTYGIAALEVQRHMRTPQGNRTDRRGRSCVVLARRVRYLPVGPLLGRDLFSRTWTLRGWDAWPTHSCLVTARRPETLRDVL